jgi:hypothetical protein
MAEERIGELKKRVEEQGKVLRSLAESLEGGDRLAQFMSRVEGYCEALTSLTSGILMEASTGLQVFRLKRVELNMSFYRYLQRITLYRFMSF